MKDSNMWRGVNFLGWVFALGSALLAIYSFCSFRFFFIWNISPPRIYLLYLSVIALILGLLGLLSRRNKIRSVVTIVLSLGLTLILLLAMTFFYVAKKETVQSPNKHTTVSFYTVDGGAATSLIYIGYVNGPLWFKKRFYESLKAPNTISWKNKATIVVNDHPIHLKQGEVYDY